MKKETREYLQGERNAVKDEFIVSRERCGSSEYVCISLPQNEEPIYKGWAKRIKVKANSMSQEEALVTVNVGVETPVVVKTPRHTGGKRPYIMLMQDREDIVKGLSLDASGLFLKIMFGGYVEWHTGKVICRRTKEPMTKDKIGKTFGIGKVRIKALLGELTAKDVLHYDKKERSYFVDRRLAKKGSGQDENKV